MNAPANFRALKALTTPETAVTAVRPFEVAVLVLPGFSHLALHAYVEPFRIANAVSRLPLFGWQIVGTSRQPVEGANGLLVAVDASMDELSAGIGDRRADQLAMMKLTAGFAATTCGTVATVREPNMALFSVLATCFFIRWGSFHRHWPRST
ncbi:hypothetical protein [Mesorhizobium sp.]|uniref:hypothetical protein n=1 Tax=Mesorhizobium sp. TaxID=1871066 RepID=UPI0025BB8424|nr:hypothetical protein [Mesorhizobium sp.]